MRPLFAALLVAACTAPNPAYDEPLTAPPSGAGDTTSAAPTGPPAPDTGATTVDDGSASSSAGDPAATTQDTGVGPTAGDTTTADPTLTTVDPSAATSDTTAGDPCVGIDCGECSACQAGQCVPGPPGGPCDDAAPPACHDLVFGLQSGRCYRYAVTQPTCDAGGQCVHDCQLQGEEIVGCQEPCINPGHNCQQGQPAAAVTLTTLCYLNSQPPTCESSCGFENATPVYNAYACDGSGNCDGAAMNCFPGHCDAMAGCLFNCQTQMDCAPGAQCVDFICKPT
jgi:hypothetical protein